jgi:hypothetical protein
MTDPGRHLLIAGTGRAGTTFLVRWLTALGFDTEASRRGRWNEDARAGHETFPLSVATADRPYVLKSPIAGLVIDDLLADPLIRLDAVVVPVRDLADAADSRIVTELAALHRDVPWLATLKRTWDQRWFTPGGALFSTDPVDQARLLAVAFHRLVERLTAAEVPLIFLAFPRMVEDAEYLFRRMAPVLPGIDFLLASAAHAKIAEPAMVRIGRADDHGFEKADNAALRRELSRVRAALAAAEAGRAQAEAGFRDSQAELARLVRPAAPAPWWRRWIGGSAGVT